MSMLQTNMSAASKLFHFGTAVLFRAPRASSPLPVILFPKPFASSKSLQLFRSNCSSAAVDSVAAEAPPQSRHHHPHPWPEWVAFVDRLSAKGYLAETLPVDESVYNDMNLLKNASLSFARDRYDVLKSLSTKDIEVIVGGGCPNLLRKAVNSAKRLRAYVQLDEGDVCSACNLRGSCDRAYMILKESEADARTVDIVRILLFYALDPLVISGVKNLSVESLLNPLQENYCLSCLSSVKPPLIQHFRSLLPGFQKKKEKSLSVTDDETSQNVEMKRGDWICPNCNFMNFSKNLRCLKCKEDGPKSVGTTEVVMKKGDWTCPECNFMNFSRNTCCLKCKAKGPNKVGLDEVEMKKGDWNCPRCQFMNFASNKKCLRCQESRPKRQLNPGEWECPSCDFLNYRRNMVCLKCNSERPTEAAINEYMEQIWRQPH